MKKRNYKREYSNYHGKPKQILNRSSRNKARRKMISAGRARKGDGKDVNHRDSNPRNNSKSNLSIMSKARNRSKRY